MQTVLENKVSDIISPSLTQMGYEIVRVKMMQINGRETLQVMLDREDGNQIDVDDCKRASIQISALLDVEDPIPDNYNLEVSSPGIDRPLTRLKDFSRFTDFEAKIETVEKVDGRRRFKGILAGTNDNDVLINVQDDKAGEYMQAVIDFDNIQNAKLVLNDELLKMSQ